MTSERLAEIEQTWEGKNLPMVRELLTALREVQRRADENFTSYEHVKAQASALQRRMEALEKGLTQLLILHGRIPGQGPASPPLIHTHERILGCPLCVRPDKIDLDIAEAALRGGEEPK